jgi:hypothetical protein
MNDAGVAPRVPGIVPRDFPAMQDRDATHHRRAERVEYLFGRNATGAFYLRAPRQVYRVFAMRARHEAG